MFIVFLLETICLKNKINSIRISLGFDCDFFVDRVSLSGGLAMFWNKDTAVTLLDYSVGHIGMCLFLYLTPIVSSLLAFIVTLKPNLDGSLPPSFSV